MTKPEYDFIVGIDWAYEAHQVCVVDRDGSVQAERVIPHRGASITSFIDWLLTIAGQRADRVAVAIEVPRGALVEMLVDRGLTVYTINPKQLDRFRDRHTVAGAKDDRRDAYVLADSLRTDRPLFHLVQIDDPLMIALREFTRMRDELQEEVTRLSNRLREQVYRFFPQMLALCPAANDPWFWDLIQLIPTPAKATRTRPKAVAQVLRKHRIRRLTAHEVLDTVRTPPVQVAGGTTEAACAHIQILLPRLQLLHGQRKATQKRIAGLLDQIGQSRDGEQPEGQQGEHRDVEIILSMPGIGITVAATMLSEAPQALAARDYQALRTQTGVAPVTRRSGKQKVVLRRYACKSRPANALYHAARVSSQVDPHGRDLYRLHRQRGHSHGRALRSIGDRLLRILVAMLASRTLYDPTRFCRVPPGSSGQLAA